MVRWQISAILGVAAAVAVTAAALITKTTDIAVDLGTRAGQVLAGEATSWASVDIHGRDVFLRGEAPSEENRRLAIERLGRLYGVRTVDASAAGLLPELRPYTTAIERSGSTVILTGAVPSLPDRARILGALAAAAPGLAIVDHSLLARGKADDRYYDLMRTLYGVPSLLAQGKVTLTDRAVTIEGEAALPPGDRLFEQLRRAEIPVRVVEVVEPVPFQATGRGSAIRHHLVMLPWLCSA
jgi:hypothetical protein